MRRTRGRSGPGGHGNNQGSGNGNYNPGYNQNRRSGNGTPSRHQVFDSNGPDVRIRGNASQVYDKYMALARDAQVSGDRVKLESYLQHAEHYYRIMLAIQEATGEMYQQRQPQEGEQPVDPAQMPQPDAETVDMTVQPQPDTAVA